MYNRYTIFIITFLCGVSCLLCLFQQHNVNKLKQRIYEKEIPTISYVKSSFDINGNEAGLEVIKSLVPSMSDSTICIFLPSSLCRSCFTSLLFSLQDNNVNWYNLKVVSEIDDYEIRSQCISRGIDYSVMGYAVDGVNDIIIVRKYNGFRPISMMYNYNYDSILTLFLSDESGV